MVIEKQNNRFKSALAAALLLFIALGFAPDAVAANCPPLPNVAWWTKSHDKVIAYVQRKYDGDWNAYVWKWLSYRKKVVRLYKLKKTLVLKSRGVKIKGSKLAEYAQQIDERIAVVKCLADAVSETDLEAAAAQEPQYNCKSVPDVPWWGDLNHDGLIALVRSRYKGEWRSLIKFWETESKVLLTSFNLGQEAIVNKAGMALSSEELALYYAKVIDLVAVLHCLADDHDRSKGSK